jgi:hypothetical protein
VTQAVESVGQRTVPTWVVLGSFDASGLDPLHLLIRAARAGEPSAVREVLGRVRRSVGPVWPTIAQGAVVPVPGHRPDRIAPLVLSAAFEIADARHWIYAGEALRRRRPAPEAKTGPARDFETEVRTLAWSPPSSGDTIVLVDDVVRTGTSIRVCSDVIRAAGDERPVLAIAIARAVTDRAR